jgi:hypothetical protein
MRHSPFWLFVIGRDVSRDHLMTSLPASGPQVKVQVLVLQIVHTQVRDRRDLIESIQERQRGESGLGH